MIHEDPPRWAGGVANGCTLSRFPAADGKVKDHLAGLYIKKV